MLETAKRELTALRGAELTDGAVEKVLAKLQRQLERMLPKEQLAAVSAALVAEVESFNARQVARQLALTEVGIKVPELTAARSEQLAQQTASTIRGIPALLVQKAAPLISDATLRGLRAEAFAGELAKRLSVTKAKAKDVATGAVLRTNATLTKERHEKLGITEYTWRASPDGLTRHWHRKLNGQRFRYDDPPIGGGGGPKDRGNPGSADKCRCQAIPVIP